LAGGGGGGELAASAKYGKHRWCHVEAEYARGREGAMAAPTELLHLKRKSATLTQRHHESTLETLTNASLCFGHFSVVDSSIQPLHLAS
jgi:chromosome condensin MukBEF MukE localization factor